MNTNTGQTSISELTNIIDHTLLKSQATSSDILKSCEQTQRYQFASLCINPCYVSFARKNLDTTCAKIACVVGFPLGAQTLRIKALETEEALENGADEIDMVMHIGAMKSGNYTLVAQDIREIARICHQANGVLKVIIETCVLTRNEKIQACKLCIAAQADFVKTSTGFSSAGATVEDVRLLHDLASPQGVGVKASGGIKTLDDALRMIAAGATRIGTSSGVAIIEEAERRILQDKE